MNTIVQDVGLELDHGIERLRVAVRERDRAAAVLAWLIDERDRSSRQAVVVALAKLEASIVARDRAVYRLTDLLTRHSKGHVA